MPRRRTQMPRIVQGSALLLKLQSLDSLNRDIRKSEKPPDDIYAIREACEQEVNRLRASMAPVHRLPPELLGDIFTLVILFESEFSESSPAYIRLTSRARRRLLLVNRLWRDTLIQIPALWNGVLVTPHSPTIFHTVNQYVRWYHMQQLSFDIHLTRSKSLPLNVIFDFASASILYRCRAGLDSEPEPDDEDAPEWLVDPPLRGLGGPEGCCELYCEMAKWVIGYKDMGMKSWRSLHIKLPNNTEHSARILSLFNQPSHHLQYLRLETHSTGLEPIFCPQSFPHLSCVTAMTLWPIFVVNTLPLCPRLQKLHIIVFLQDYDWMNLSSLSQITTLTMLTIEVASGWDYSKEVTGPIQLPDLYLLKLKGKIPYKVLKALETKRLEKLAIVRFHPGYGSIPPCHLFSIPEDINISFCDHDLDNRRRHLVDILSQTSKVKKLKVSVHTASITLSVITQLRSSGLLKQLESMTTVDEPERRTRLDPWEDPWRL